MRTNTFAHLQNLCAAKGIVCERTRGKIEMTTPDGSTTAECSSLAEAFSEFQTSPFAELPIKLARTGWQREQETKAKQAMSVTALDKLRAVVTKLHEQSGLAGSDAGVLFGLIREAEEERSRHVAALNKLAQWSDGSPVGSRFDCPWAATTAREALGKL